jgi:hypothetical protein
MRGCDQLMVVLVVLGAIFQAGAGMKGLAGELFVT